MPFYKLTDFWMKAAAVMLVAVISGYIALYIGNKAGSEMHTEVNFKQTTLSNGQTASLQFGDGTIVKLNGGSSLRYPETFAGDHRTIYLDGEAFFEVAHDDTRPFIVHAGETETRVLGTSFNIKAYGAEDEIQIAVEEGKVAVTRSNSVEMPDDAEPILVEESQWLTYRLPGNILEKGDGDIRELIAWKDRILLFSNKTFEEVAAMLERWYGVEMMIENPELKEILLEGEHLDVSLEEVIKSIQFVMDFEYEIGNGYVRIY